jgi:pyruvate/2-oxoglutarate dehydrogenase complex dihydrolipoamide dehydrogenase (E3) component/uncharacterized membrane protein YdjX (TVP38/TMEM64 family)
MKRIHFKYVFLVLIVAAVAAVLLSDAHHFLSLESMKQNQERLVQAFHESPLFMASLFAAIYIISTALSIPGATVLTLAAGAIFGVAIGTMIVSFSSTIGASLAFLGSRYFFGDFVQKKFKERLKVVDAGLQKEGSFYLLSLRLLPLFPFFVVNLVMGLTNFGIGRYFIISLIGMLPGTLVYVNAGTQLSKINSVKEILSPPVFLSFLLLGILPLLAKFIISYLKSRKHLRKYKKPKIFDYNIVVIGGGSAGLVSAYIASAIKAKVALIEKHKMGGDCLNTGCVPSKALIRSAKIINYLKRAEEFGLEEVQSQVRFSKVMERIQSVIRKIEPHDSIERYTELGVECFTGEAQILSPYEVKVNGKILATKTIIVATGARPWVPSIPGMEQIRPLTSDNLWEIRELPQKLLVLGGGPIGCELAQSFARLGSKVTLVEKSDRVLSREDGDAAALVTKSFYVDGVDIRTSHRAIRIEKNLNSYNLICDYAGKEVALEFDQILVALGRKANVSGFGLEELKVEISKTGTIEADEFLRTTNYPNIYVCGDVTGPYQFTHTASHQAWYASVNALFSPLKTFKVDYRVIPWCTFTDPEVARVGLSESEAIEKGIEFEVTKYEIEDLDRAIADSEARGFVKILTAQGSDKILGATIVGSHAGDIISEYVTAMKYNLGLNKILNTIHIYPTLSEANKAVAGLWKKKNAPQKLLKLLRYFHNWRRT